VVFKEPAIFEPPTGDNGDDWAYHQLLELGSYAMFRRYFEQTADAFFHTNEEGVTAFFPAGLLGRRGFIVESPEREQDLRAAIRRAFVGLFILIAIYSIVYTTVYFVWMEMFHTIFVEHGLFAYFGAKYLPIMAMAALMLAGLVAYLRRYTAGMARASFPNGTTHMDQLLKMNPSVLRISTMLSTIVLVLALVLAVSFPEMILLLLIFAIPQGLYTAFLWRGVLELGKQKRMRNAS